MTNETILTSKGGDEAVVDTPPSVARVAVAIAGYPYSTRAATLDIIDNSVESGANGVAVALEQTGKELHSISIIDNGTGIRPEILDEVLRAGSRTKHLYSDQSLARYGIGLKGAGFSLGSKITLLTRCEGEPLRRRSIDLREIVASDRWLQEARDPNSEEANYFERQLRGLPGTGQRETGTVVLIEHLNIRSKDVTRLTSDITRSVGETYGKFLSGSGANAILSIRVDGTDITGVDPLHREHERTVPFYKRHEIKVADGVSLFFSAVALPHPNTLPPEMRKRWRFTQENQGIYVYRNGRLVMGGQTLGFFGKDFHLNAFRAELEYTSAADEHVLVDVAKSNVNLSPEVAAALQDLVQNSTTTADTLWREKDVLTEEDIQQLFDESNSLIGSRHKLLVDLSRIRRKVEPGPRSPVTRPPVKPGAPKKTREIPYLVPKDSLPEDVLYRPMFDGALEAMVVEVNLSHPFSKAVFSVSPGERRNAVPRQATTAAQQLLYVLGNAEWGLSDDEDNKELLLQFRRYASMNLRALLAD